VVADHLKHYAVGIGNDGMMRKAIYVRMVDDERWMGVAHRGRQTPPHRRQHAHSSESEHVKYEDADGRFVSAEAAQEWLASVAQYPLPQGGGRRALSLYLLYSLTVLALLVPKYRSCAAPLLRLHSGSIKALLGLH
jgi:hypothetical protein